MLQRMPVARVREQDPLTRSVSSRRVLKDFIVQDYRAIGIFRERCVSTGSTESQSATTAILPYESAERGHRACSMRHGARKKSPTRLSNCWWLARIHQCATDSEWAVILPALPEPNSRCVRLPKIWGRCCGNCKWADKAVAARYEPPLALLFDMNLTNLV